MTATTNGYVGSIRSRLETTVSVTTGSLRRRDSVGVVLGVTVAYLVVFLWAVNQLSFQTGIGFSTTVVSDPLTRMFEPGIGPFIYEPIALIDLWVIRLLFSPVNMVLGLTIAGFVGLNIGLSYLAVTQPKSCGLGTSAGILASIPALLAGSTCCAPVILLVLGIQASGIIMTGFSVLLPAGIALLLGSLVYLAGKIDPTAV